MELVRRVGAAWQVKRWLARGYVILLAAVVCLALGSGRADAASGIETAGSARFTVVTPTLIRMESAANGKFIDAASWFARERMVRDTDYRVSRDGQTLTIDTGVIRLTYTNDGQGFSEQNLKAQIKAANGIVTWTPAATQTTNLGGAIRGLDRTRAAVPMGLGLLSRDGWYLYDDSTSVLASGDWFKERPSDHGTDWYLFGYGSDYKAALQSLTTIGGKIPLPRKCTMGVWYSRNWPYTADEFKQIVEEYQQNDFPLDIIVMDYGWHIPGWTGYTWNAKRIPDPDELLQWYHRQGLSVTLNDHPDHSVQPTESMYASFMRAMGEDPASGKTIPFDAGNQRYFDTFWKYTHEPLMRQGVDFWWLDIGKPAMASLPSLDGLSMLNDFYFKHTDVDGKRGQSFSRWAGWGDHRDPIHFSGDADSGWNMLRFEVPFTSTSGNVGCFFWSHDTGGYRGGLNDESYTRWAQFDALSAALRCHSAGDMDRRPWKYPAWATESMRQSFHLRACLIPYVYTAAAQAAQDSVPMVRPLYIDHPDQDASYINGQEYQFGQNLLVAPIATPGYGDNRVSWQHVRFADGTWFQYFTGEKYTGPSDVIAAADVNEFPLFARGGVPLPEQPYTPRPTSAPLSKLVLRCFPGDEGRTGTSELYEDDGISDDYQHGGFATTQLSYSRQGDQITVRVAPAHGSYRGQVRSRAYTVLLPATQQGTLLGPADGGISYDPATQTNRITVAETPIDQEIVIKVKAADADSAQIRQRAQMRRLDGLLGKPYAQWSESDRAGASAGVLAAVEAIQGRALMAINQNPYLYGHDVKLAYFDPDAASPVDGALSYKSWSMPITAASGQEFNFAPAAHALAPQDIISVPGVENRWFLKLKGRDTSVSLDTAQLAYNLDDLALDAKPSTSKGRGENAIDGVADGAPDHPDNEWTLNKGTTEGWIKLTWPESIKAQRILLYDRPNLQDQVLAGRLTFSDGSKLDVGPLPNDGRTPAEITFPEKRISWVRFQITKCSPTTKTAGLGEFAVFDR